MNTDNRNVVTAAQNNLEDNKTLGLIGLGHMGAPIAKRLLDHGYRLIVFDRTREKAEKLAPHGATLAFVIADLAREADIILSSLSDDRAVLEVYNGLGGVLSHARPGTLIIEMSTVRPTTSKELYAAGRYRQIDVLDVAIS